MKKSILLFVGLILFGLNAIAQNSYNLVIFSEEGEGFYAIVNGIRQNDKPETNVKITGLTAEALSLRVEFENKALPKLKQNMMGEPGFEHTIRIKTTMKKEKKLQYFGKVALGEAPNSGATNVAYHTSENAQPLSENSNVNVVGGEDLGNTTITTTSVSTTTKVNSDPNNISVNINDGGVGISMKIDGMDGVQGTQNSTTSTTVTKTSYSSSSSSSSSGYNNNTNNTNNTKTQNNHNTTSAVGCSAPMNTTSFDKLKQSVESKPFSDTKMSTAKVATKNACLSVAQVKTICGLFSMDDEKLTYAKYAYDSCVEKSNFYQVSEIFSFSGTTEDLNKFLETK